MRKLLIISIFSLFATGCSFVEITREDHAFRAEKNVPQRPELPFKNKEQLSRATALNLDKAEKVYYEGAEPKEKSAEIILKLAKKFISTLGINTDFDPSDPKSVEKVFSGIDEANAKIREQNAVLMEQIKQVNNEKAKIIRDKAKELEMKSKENSTLKTKLGSLWAWIMLIFWIIIIGVVVLIIFVPSLGIPLARRIWGATIGLTISAGKNTMKAVQEMRTELKEKVEKEHDENAKRHLDLLHSKLEKLQTPEEVAHIKKLKASKKL